MKNSLLKETETIGDNMNQFVMLKKSMIRQRGYDKIAMKNMFNWLSEIAHKRMSSGHY